MKETYLEKVIAETLKPVMKAVELLSQEIEESMHIPDAPWKILNKPYDELSDQEMMALFDIYHTPNEPEPCPMCSWSAKMELQRINKNNEEFGG